MSEQGYLDVVKDNIENEFYSMLSEGGKEKYNTAGNIVALYCHKMKIDSVEFVTRLARVWCYNILSDYLKDKESL